MKIKNGRRHEWARLLRKVATLAVLVAGMMVLVQIRRIEGDAEAPLYKDGDLVLAFRFSDAPFLQLRVRGFDD